MVDRDLVLVDELAASFDLLKRAGILDVRDRLVDLRAFAKAILERFRI